jgi:POT family proton-dependent oligopeptide transporter
MGAITHRDRFGHPQGLWVLAATELFDRISYHAMQALLVLYMAGQLLLPGHVENVAGFQRYREIVESVTGPMSSQAIAIQTFGLYSAFVSFTPIFGGLIGDRLTGRRFAVAAGALLMTAGHFCLAFEVSFLPALLLLILGAGLYRGNLSAQIKALYDDGDRRQADAFQIYYLMISTGGFLAPLISGALAAAYGWHAGFTFAGFGMLVGLVIYLAGQRHLPPEPKRTAAEPAPPLTRHDWHNIAGLMAIWPISLGFWIAQSQVWNVYNIWARDHVDLTVGSFVVPVPWLSSLDGLAPAAWSLIVMAWWRRQARRGKEADLFVKLATGCLVFSAGTLLLAASPLLAGADGRTPLLVPISFHLVSNLGWTLFAPVMIALYATKAPVGARGTLIGINTLSLFVAQIITGRMGGFYETVSPAVFWGVNAAIVGTAGLIMLLAAPAARRWFGQTV